MSTRGHVIRVLRATLAQGVLSGLVVGGLTGLLEVQALLSTTRGTASSFLLPSMLFYGALWTLVAVALGLLRLLSCSLFQRLLVPREPLARWYLAILIPLALVLVGGGHINMRYLP